MTYFEGFIVPVPESNKEAFAKHANHLSPSLRECGVRRQLEAWDSDIPQGKVTDFRKAVESKTDEKVVIAWFEYPDRQARDAANRSMMSNPNMAQMGTDLPFDSKRMILGGFEAIVEEGSAGGNYVDGFIVPVAKGKREDYRALASKMAKRFRQHGANRVVECFGDDVPKGEVTDFYRAVKAEDDEGVVFSFIEWPNKKVRDSAWDKIMADESLRPQEMPFDGTRMFWGGFDVLIDTAQMQPREAMTPISA